MNGQMKALLAALAVAGYQHRGQIAEVLRGIGGGNQQTPQGQANSAQPSQSGSLGGLLGGLAGGGGLGGLLGGASVGNILSNGLGGLLDQFRQNGQEETVNSWVSPGNNQPVDNRQLSQALGADTINDLVAKTGLSEDEILSRLSRDLPKAVNDLTPDGKVPDEKSFAQMLV